MAQHHVIKCLCNYIYNTEIFRVSSYSYGSAVHVGCRSGMLDIFENIFQVLQT